MINDNEEMKLKKDSEETIQEVQDTANEPKKRGRRKN